MAHHPYLILFGETGVTTDEDPHDAGVAVSRAGVQRRVAVLKVTGLPLDGDTVAAPGHPPRHPAT